MPGVLQIGRVLVAISFVLPIQAEVVQFYYNLQKDYCGWGSNQPSLADNNTFNGGLCAYVQSINRIYSCPAPDPACWAWYSKCASNNEPGPNQIKCTRGSTTWCCSSQETCTVTKGQINVCISQFQSPNSGISPADARVAEFSAIPSASLATTAVTAFPSILTQSTFALANVGTSTGSVSSSATSQSSTATSSRPTSATSASSTTSSTSLSNSSSPSSGLSGGAIAGIVIGALAGLALIGGGIAYYIIRQRRAQTVAAGAPPYQHPPQGYYHEKGSSPLSEAPPSQPQPRAEMPDHGLMSYPNGRHELQ